jgi:hypothetical protein
MFNTERKTKFNTREHKRQREDYNMNDNGFWINYVIWRVLLKEKITVAREKVYYT